MGDIKKFVKDLLNKASKSMGVHYVRIPVAKLRQVDAALARIEELEGDIEFLSIALKDANERNSDLVMKLANKEVGDIFEDLNKKSPLLGKEQAWGDCYGAS